MIFAQWRCFSFLKISKLVKIIINICFITNTYYIYVNVGVIGPRMHIYIYIGPGVQFEDMNSLRKGKHLPKNLCW